MERGSFQDFRSLDCSTFFYLFDAEPSRVNGKQKQLHGDGCRPCNQRGRDCLDWAKCVKEGAAMVYGEQLVLHTPYAPVMRRALKDAWNQFAMESHAAAPAPPESTLPHPK